MESRLTSNYVDKASLELTILLPKSSEYWNYKYAPPCPARHMTFKPMIYFMCSKMLPLLKMFNKKEKNFKKCLTESRNVKTGPV
jgi:carbonic anhydrase